MNTRNSLRSLAAAAALIAGGTIAAHAEGLYAGAALGSPHYGGDAVAGIDGSGSGVGGKIYGGYELTPNFAIEGGWFDAGHIDNANGKADLRGAYLDAVGKYPIAPQWSLRGSVGVAEGHFDTSRGDDHSPALKLGVGVDYALTQKVSLSAGYDYYRFSNAFDGKPTVGMPTIGMKIGF
ncbi:outer membrane beta-barrel protein [Caldimonas sp. KR1-144]|uniref:outer membrane beta-barrel protein n=1 Tax=Caldimonas sp. KR1-144 TaxID=3400911 RepID=UPI003C0655AD